MNKVLVTWSIAYDYIMQVDNEFKNMILPDQIEKLNVGFVASHMTKSDGWTAVNIAYNLWLLGCKDQTLMLASAGKDYQTDQRLSQYIDFSHIQKVADDFTACAYVITDLKHNQIIPFYPGAMNQSDKQSLSWFTDVAYCIVAPNAKSAMMKFIQEAHDLQIPCFFDPGQALWLFNREELLQCLDAANYLICNDYEFDLVLKTSWLSKEEIVKKLDKIIITLWKDGATLLDSTNEITIPWCKVEHVIDPTWAGDSFRSGLLCGLLSGKSREASIKMGNAVGSLVVQSMGTMNHTFTLQEIEEMVNA